MALFGKSRNPASGEGIQARRGHAAKTKDARAKAPQSEGRFKNYAVRFLEPCLLSFSVSWGCPRRTLPLRNLVQPPQQLKCAFPRTPGDNVGRRQTLIFSLTLYLGGSGGRGRFAHLVVAGVGTRSSFTLKESRAPRLLPSLLLPILAFGGGKGGQGARGLLGRPRAPALQAE